MIADKIIMFFLCLMIFFLPISTAVIEVSAAICIFVWAIKNILILWRKKEFNLLVKSKNLFIKTSNLNKALILFICANFLSMIFSSDFILSVDAFFSKLIEYVLIFVIVRGTVNSRLRYKTIIWVMLSALLFIGLDGLFQVISGHDLFRHRALFQSRATASFINPNNLGSYLITLIPIGLTLFFSDFNKKIKLGLVVLLFIAFSTLLLSISKGAIVALFPVLVFIGLYTKKRYVFLIFASILILVIILNISFKTFSLMAIVGRVSMFLSDSGAIDRQFLWAASVRMFLANPIFGVGLGTFMKSYQIFWLMKTTEISYAHNCYLQILAETGIVGLFTFLLLLVVWLREALSILSRKKKSFFYFSFLGITAGLIAYLLNSFLDTNLYSLPIAVLFWYVLGLHQAGARLVGDE